MPIKIQKLKKSYMTDVVLNGIDLELNAGEVFCLVGVNGAGKTTLLKCLLDFHNAEQGSISLFNINSSDTQSREKIAYLPERFVPPHYFNGEQFFKYIFDLYKLKIEREAILEMLNALDLAPSVLSQSVRKFSKGMAQKLGLAALFLLNKPLLILDEPMSGLDPKARALVKQQILKANKNGATVFFSSHLLADVEELSHRIAILDQGQFAFCGTSEDCKKQYQASNLEQAFLNCIA